MTSLIINKTLLVEPSYFPIQSPSSSLHTTTLPSQILTFSKSPSFSHQKSPLDTANFSQEEKQGIT